MLNCKWITACVTTTMSILNNKGTLIVCQLLLSTLAIGLFQVGRQDAGKMLCNMVLASLLSTWNIAITHMNDSIVCVFICHILNVYDYCIQLLRLVIILSYLGMPVNQV